MKTKEVGSNWRPFKKVINGVSYNVCYDAEFLCQYRYVLDGWAHSVVYVYKKKSTGQYFEYDVYGGWNDSRSISLISEKKAERRIEMCKKYGEKVTLYGCLMTSVYDHYSRCTRKKGYSWWWTSDKDPWMWKYDEEGQKKEKERREKEKERREQRKKERAVYVEEMKKKDESGVYGVFEISRVCEGKEFRSYDDRPLDFDKRNRLRYFRVSMRLINSDYDKKAKFRSWWTYGLDVIDDKSVDKFEIRDRIKGIVDEIKAEKGEFEPATKGGELVSSVKNSEMMELLAKKVREQNKEICFS